MVFFSKYRIVFSIIVAGLLVAAAAGAIFWARGFKIDFQKRSLERTGLLVAGSIPTGAEIFLDGRLTSATDTTIAYLEPKTYRIKITKDGFTPWEKDVEIKADLSTEIKALLFPLAPEIKPLTITGAINPTISPDGTRIVFATSGEKSGLYQLTMNESSIPFRQDTRFLAANNAQVNYAKAAFIWGPDSKQVIAQFSENDQINANLLVDTDKSNQEPRDVTATLASTIRSWQDELNSKAQTQALSAPESVKNSTQSATVQTSSPSPTPVLNQVSPSSNTLISQKPGNLINYHPTGMVFSPDEEKILYKDKKGSYKVYDLKLKKESSLPDFADLQTISWYSDSNHLVLAQNPPAGGSISIIEADGTNKLPIYSGKFIDGFVYPYPSGTRIIILTTLTQSEGTPPNLYAINLR